MQVRSRSVQTCKPALVTRPATRRQVVPLLAHFRDLNAQNFRRGVGHHKIGYSSSTLQASGKVILSTSTPTPSPTRTAAPQLLREAPSRLRHDLVHEYPIFSGSSSLTPVFHTTQVALSLLALAAAPAKVVWDTSIVPPLLPGCCCRRCGQERTALDERVPGGQDFSFSPPNNQPAHGLISFISRTLVRLRHCCSSVQAPDASDFITRWSGSHTEEPTVVAAAAGHGHAIRPPTPTSTTQGVPAAVDSCTATQQRPRRLRPRRRSTAAATELPVPTSVPTAALTHSHTAAASGTAPSAASRTQRPAPTSLARVSRPRLRRQTARHRAEQLVRGSPRRRSASATLRTGILLGEAACTRLQLRAVTVRDCSLQRAKFEH